MTTEVKLPKQFRHWCQKAGLKPRCKDSQQQHNWFYLVGHGRNWRVDCNNMFEVGDTYADFDRWALCCSTETVMPKSLKEFMIMVKRLLDTARARDTDINDDRYETVTLVYGEN